MIAVCLGWITRIGLIKQVLNSHQDLLHCNGWSPSLLEQGRYELNGLGLAQDHFKVLVGCLDLILLCFIKNIFAEIEKVLNPS
jgi:hypothetical protein